MDNIDEDDKGLIISSDGYKLENSKAIEKSDS